MASPGRCSRSAIAAAQTAQIGRRVILRFGVRSAGAFFFWPDYDWMIIVGWNPGRAIPLSQRKPRLAHSSLEEMIPGRGFLFGST